MSVASQLTDHHADHVTFQVGEHQLAALDTGGGGPTVLMVPGFTGSKEDFAPLLDPLRQRGFRAVSYDQLGQYESAGPDDETAYTPQALAAHTVAVLAQLPGPYVLLGHSYGGLVTQAAIRAGTRVAAVVLLCSGPGALPADSDRSVNMLASRQILNTRGVPALAQMRAEADAAGPRPPHPELADFFKRRFLPSPAAMLLGMGHALITEPDQSAETAAALDEMKVFVIAGRDDDAWPLAEQAAMAHRYGTELIIIEDAGHCPNTENPVALLAALEPALEAARRS